MTPEDLWSLEVTKIRCPRCDARLRILSVGDKPDDKRTILICPLDFYQEEE